MSREQRCERKGHKWQTQTRRGYEDGHPDFDFYHFRCVGHSVMQERQVCRRCGNGSDWVTVDDHCINSLTLSTHISSELRRKKVVWL